jgi:hypothetical protein
VIWNVIDRRERPYRWKTINAIIEPTFHDNSVDDSDHAHPEDVESPYDTREGISLAEAIEWASALDYGVTLYLYDLGKGI